MLEIVPLHLTAAGAVERLLPQRVGFEFGGLLRKLLLKGNLLSLV